MDTVHQTVSAAFGKLDDLLAFLGRHAKALAIILCLLLGWHVAGLAKGVAIVAMLLLNGFAPRKYRLGIIGAAIGLLFGWAGFAIGLGLGLLNGSMIELGWNDPPEKVAREVGRLDGIVLAGLYIMAAGGGSPASLIIMAIFYLMGGFIGETLLGFARFLRTLGAEEPKGRHSA